MVGRSVGRFVVGLLRCPRTACLRRGPKIIYSHYTRCVLIRDRQEATCIWKVSPQIVVERFLKVCIMSVKLEAVFVREVKKSMM